MTAEKLETERRRTSPLAMMLQLALILAPSLAAAAPSLGAPVHLRVEGLLEDVAVISEAEPRFSFVHSAEKPTKHGVTQASYRITVKEHGGKTAAWDSGDVKSPNSTEIAYAGSALKPFTRYDWTLE